VNEFIKVSLTAEVGGFLAGMNQVSGSLSAVDAQMKAMASNDNAQVQAVAGAINSLGDAFLVAGAAGIAVLTSWGVMAANFEQGMRNVNAVLQLGGEAFAQESNTVLDMASQFPEKLSSATAAMSEIVTSGFTNISDANDVLHASLVAGAAGMTDTATAAGLITNALKAYGQTAQDSTAVSDVMFKTVSTGAISFKDLSSGMGSWLAIASTAHVPLDAASAALATMTRSGLTAQQAGEGLTRVLDEMLHPSKELQIVLKDLGYASTQSMLDTLGLKGTMDVLRVATNGSAEGIASLFRNVRAARAAFALFADGG
jgi:TP901 family phage tail tape measure protein